MPRKKSIKKAAQSFVAAADEILSFTSRLAPNATASDLSWIHDYAIIRLYREFESLALAVHVRTGGNSTSVAQ